MLTDVVQVDAGVDEDADKAGNAKPYGDIKG